MIRRRGREVLANALGAKGVQYRALRAALREDEGLRGPARSTRP